MTSHVLKKRKIEHPSSQVNEKTESDDDSVTHREARLLSMERDSETTVSAGRDTPKLTSLGPRTKSMRPGNIYASDVFQIQIGELLTEVRPDFGKRRARVDHALRKLKTVIGSIPPRKAKPVSEAEAALTAESQIAVPWPSSGSIRHLKYSVAYDKPKDVKVVGSFALETAIKSEERLIIDMAVTMPSGLFQVKDYLDYRYFHKRAYYLACIASGLKGANNCRFEIQYEYQNGNTLQPVILVSPIPDGSEDDFSSSNCHIRILLAACSVVFPADRTLPWKKCVRSKYTNDSPLPSSPSPSPVYNATLRAECSTAAYLKLLRTAKAQAIGFTDACILGNVWLRQRGFGTGRLSGGFGGFEIACMIALLLRGGGLKGRPLLSTGYSSYQAFAALLQFLASTDLIRLPLLIGEGASYDVALFRANTPVLFDTTRGLNVLFKMTQASYRKLQHEVRLTLKLLNGSIFDRFEPTFICKVNDPMKEYDNILSLSINPFSKSVDSAANSIEAFLACCTKVYTVLNTGFSDRVTLIYPQARLFVPWTTERSMPACPEKYEIIIGLLVDTGQMARSVEHGPSVEDKQAATSFREFWGEKAELRRFKDGRILESLLWSESGHSKSILQQIARYVIERHIGPDVASSVRLVAGSFDEMLPDFQASSNPVGIFQSSLHAFEELATQIRELEGLPLQVKKISASCASLRYASIWPPQEISSAGTARQPMDITIQFEGSNRWPEDITSIHMTKIAFFLKLSELIEEAVAGVHARLGLENEDHAPLNSSFLDIIYPDATAFRLRIYHELEPVLLERRLRDKNSASYQREDAASAFASFKRTFIQSPSHTQAVSTLCTRFPLLSPSVRLMKQWCSSHLLSDHLSGELIELLTIRAFLNSHPWTPPGSIRTAILRTLIFIADWNWWSEPLIVDFGNAMTVKDVEAINVRFNAWRKIDPALNRVILFAASNLDPEGITWTERSPSKVVAARFTSLAQAACRAARDHGMNLDAKMLFASSLADYDFVIRLHPTFRGQPKKKASALFKNLLMADSQHPTMVGYDPEQLFVEELKRIYGHSIVLCYNDSSRNVIAGLWNPHMESRPWKVNLGYSTLPSGETRLTEDDSEGPRVSVNKTGILHDIARLGGEMISTIDVKGPN
ncbi:hypothetical protein MMC13_005813 [Lambiella insularis]|nr:hypothetical protein [Lambiella insularis]